MASPTILCALRSGGDYNAEYVERLLNGVKRHAPAGTRFVCLSDTPTPGERIPLAYDWPGWWVKMEFYRPDLDELGDVLTLDLDTVVVGDLSEILAAARLTMLTDVYDPEGGVNSSVTFLPRARRAEIWAKWIADPAAQMAKYGTSGDPVFLGGDQKFLEDGYGAQNIARWQDLTPGQLVSYKAHVRRAKHAQDHGNGHIPPEARLVYFHGKPRPRALNWLEGPGPWSDRSRPREAVSRFWAKLRGR